MTTRTAGRDLRPRSDAAAEIRVRVALDSIQEAQRLIQQAAQALSRVDGMIPKSTKVASASDSLTQIWYSVSAGANRLRRKSNFESPDGQ